MFGNTYYHGSIEKLVATFGLLFSNIHIQRSDASLIKVPILFGSKQKWYSMITGDPNTGDIENQKHVEVSVPRMSFEYHAPVFDPERKLTSVNRIVKVSGTDNSVLNNAFTPVPFNFSFSLHVFTLNQEDMLRIVEQILPEFRPDFTVTLTELPDLGVLRNIPIILNSIEVEDNPYGEFTVRRTLIWTLNFTLKSHLYSRVKNSPVITSSTERFLTESGFYDVAPPGITFTVQPSPSNERADVDPIDITITRS